MLILEERVQDLEKSLAEKDEELTSVKNTADDTMSRLTEQIRQQADAIRRHQHHQGQQRAL